jgi:hypothetical protein
VASVRSSNYKWLDFDEDAFAPKEPVGDETEDDEGESEGDRGGFG